MTRILFAVSAIALMGLPLSAHAQAISTVTITGEVEEACTLGAPADSTLSLGDLTGADGRLAAALTGTAVSRSTTINVAWCNTPSEMTLTAEPLSLVTVPGYTTPTGFSRLITYDVTIGGWAAPLAHRPTGSVASSSEVSASSAWAADPLEINISNLESLDSSGASETPTAFVEAGAYSATITVALAVQ